MIKRNVKWLIYYESSRLEWWKGRSLVVKVFDPMIEVVLLRAEGTKWSVLNTSAGLHITELLLDWVQGRSSRSDLPLSDLQIVLYFHAAGNCDWKSAQSCLCCSGQPLEDFKGNTCWMLWLGFFLNSGQAINTTIEEPRFNEVLCTMTMSCVILKVYLSDIANGINATGSLPSLFQNTLT